MQGFHVLAFRIAEIFLFGNVDFYFNQLVSGPRIIQALNTPLFHTKQFARLRT